MPRPAFARRLPARKRPRAKPKRKRPVPRAPLRRLKSPQPPRAVEIYLVAALSRVMARFQRALRRRLTPAAFDTIAKARRPEKTKTDALHLDGLGDDLDIDVDLTEEEEQALEDEIEEIIAEIRASAEEVAAETAEITRAATETGKRTLKHSHNEFKRLGIKVEKEPETRALISGWTTDLVDRMAGYQAEQLDVIEEILRDGYGLRAESLSDTIMARLGRSDEFPDGILQRHADFMARDAVLSINGLITGERQTAAGIEEYIWTTSNDERVRDAHQALEGQTFSWESGGDPEEGHPGEAPNCRCVAFPILPELDEGADENTDEEELN